jgi:hypothetical protein
MARRRRAARRRRRDTRFNILATAESLVYGSIITEAAFDTNIVDFFTGKAGGAGTQLTQLLQNPGPSLDQIGNRLSDPQVIIQAGVQSVMTGLLFGVFTKALAKPRRKVNAGLKQLGVPVKM